MQLKPLKEILSSTKEKIDEALAPVRARQIKSAADVRSAQLEEKLLTLERQITEACSTKDINFDKVLDLMDEYDLTERRIKQLKQLADQLFPAEVTK